MPDEKTIDAWDKALDDFMEARANLKQQLGTKFEPSARLAHDLALERYTKASDKLG